MLWLLCLLLPVVTSSVIVVVVVVVIVVTSLVIVIVTTTTTRICLLIIVLTPVSVVVFLFSKLLFLVVVHNIVGQLDELDLDPSDVDGVCLVGFFGKWVCNNGIFHGNVHPVVHVLQSPLHCDTGLLFHDNLDSFDGV